MSIRHARGFMEGVLLLNGLLAFLQLKLSIAQDGFEFSEQNWHMSPYFNTSSGLLVYHYKKLSHSERKQAARITEFHKLQEICDNQYGSKLVSWREITTNHFISVVSSSSFKPYKFNQLRSIVLEHGFFVDSYYGSKTVFWVCRGDRFLLDVWTNSSTWKSSRGCMSHNTDIEPPDVLCLETRPHPTTAQPFEAGTTNFPLHPMIQSPEDCPTGSQLAVSGLSDNAWDVFLIQHRYFVLSGTILCVLALLSLSSLLLIMVYRTRRLPPKKPPLSRHLSYSEALSNATTQMGCGDEPLGFESLMTCSGHEKVSIADSTFYPSNSSTMSCSMHLAMCEKGAGRGQQDSLIRKNARPYHTSSPEHHSISCDATNTPCRNNSSPSHNKTAHFYPVPLILSHNSHQNATPRDVLL